MYLLYNSDGITFVFSRQGNKEDLVRDFDYVVNILELLSWWSVKMELLCPLCCYKLSDWLPSW